MKKRLLYYKIEPYLTHKNALVITGMRQVGKTTLMRQLYEAVGDKPKLWYDLDNPLERKVFESEDYRGIIARLMRESGGESGKLVVFLDEVQNLPEITRLIKYGIDHNRIKFVVTGSSSYYLKNLFPESLSGRKFVFILNPMRFRELLYFREMLSFEEASKSKWPIDNDEIESKKRETYYEEYLKYGGFPEVVSTPKVAVKKLILKNIFASFFEKDLRLLSDYTDMRELRDLILLLVPRVGSMLDVTRLARELSVSRVKIYQYLELLQGTLFLYLLPKYTKSVDRAVAGGKKVYFSDTGILRSVGEVNAGQLLENGVVNQLSEYGELAYYNRRGASEIDVVVDKKLAVEIKLRGTGHDGKRVKKIAESIGVKKSCVVSQRWVDESGVVSAMMV